MSEFNSIERPAELKAPLIGGYDGTTGGFQGAHVTGKDFWKTHLKFLNEILLGDAPSTVHFAKPVGCMEVAQPCNAP